MWVCMYVGIVGGKSWGASSISSFLTRKASRCPGGGGACISAPPQFPATATSARQLPTAFYLLPDYLPAFYPAFGVESRHGPFPVETEAVPMCLPYRGGFGGRYLESMYISLCYVGGINQEREKKATFVFDIFYFYFSKKNKKNSNNGKPLKCHGWRFPPLECHRFRAYYRQ